MEAVWLDEVLEEFEDDLAPAGANESFTPTTEAEFEWALRKRARSSAKLREMYAAKEFELERLARAFDKRIEAEQRTADFFTAMIERGVEALEPDAKGKRGVKTVAGTVYTRTTEHFEWPDGDVLVAFAKASIPEAVIVSERADKALIKAHIKETGEAPEGLSVTPQTTVVIKEA